MRKVFDDLVLQCESLLSNGYTIKYVPVSKGNNRVYNDLYYKEVLEKRLMTKFEVLDWEESFSSFVQEVKNADIVVTARLHLFLVASFLWVETKVYPYQMKILKMKKIIQEFLKSSIIIHITYNNFIKSTRKERLFFLLITIFLILFILDIKEWRFFNLLKIHYDI